MPAPGNTTTSLLRLRPEQVDHLLQESFPRHLGRSVRVVWPEQTADMSDEDLEDRIERGIDKARAYGFSERDTITRFVHLSFLLTNEEFDTAPETSWAGVILGWSMDETKKLDKLEQRAALEQEKALMAAWHDSASSQRNEVEGEAAVAATAATREQRDSDG